MLTVFSMFYMQAFPASLASQFSSSVLAAHGAPLAQQTTVSSALQLQIPNVSMDKYILEVFDQNWLN